MHKKPVVRDEVLDSADELNICRYQAICCAK